MSYPINILSLIWVVVPILTVIYGVFMASYLLFFHPLAKIPGPKLYCVSLVPHLYHTVRGEWSHVLKQLHDQYGPVVRYAPNDVSFITPTAWKKIYGHKTAGEQSFNKDRRFYRLSGPSNIVTGNDADHSRMRQILAHAFSDKALRGQADVLKEYGDLFIARLREKAHKKEDIDIAQWFNFATFDLLGNLAFGESFGCLKSGGYHPWVAMIFKGFQLSVYIYAMQRMPILKPLGLFLIPRSLAQSLNEHQQLSANTVRKRLDTGGMDREDFMSYILRHRDSEKAMSVEEIIENANILIVAGSETTATALSGSIFQLLTNRSSYNKIVMEIRTRFSSEDEITVVNVNALEYTIAVLNESIRMYPPVPIGLPRHVPHGGEIIEGYSLPENTVVSVPQWPAYQSERNFSQPQKFVPERWLGHEKYAGDVRDVMQPFSTGPRNCIGKNLAMLEMRLLLVRLLWNFDLELLPESYDWYKQRVYKMWEKGPLNVKITPVVHGE